MNSVPAISVCIPAYQNLHHLRRLLDSISRQTFTDYEVIITDDTRDDTVKSILDDYGSLPIKYFKNPEQLGTPENWNESMRKAGGKWIKLMHNDDWFESNRALQVFYDATLAVPSCDFFFAAFQNIIEKTGEKEIVRCNWLDLLFLKLSPLHLVKRVYVGNPSCTLVRKEHNLFYDRQFKFVVDFEYYIRMIRRRKGYRYIDEVLLNIGFHDEQVTRFTFLVPEVQIPENLILLDKLGVKILMNPVVYDYYWRMIRNLGIREISEVKKSYDGPVPFLLQRMISFQSKISAGLLKNGLISKTLMFFHYITSLFFRH
jgi:glycosyltransferase involved in cell wall biosynthesis